MASFCMGRLLFVKKFTLYFRRLNFFLWSIVIVLLLQQVHYQKPPVYTAESCSNESVFLFFSTKSEQTAIQQSHIINPLLTSFAWSVRESIAFGFYRTDLAPSSLGLYENLRQYFPVQTSHSVNKSLVYFNCPFVWLISLNAHALFSAAPHETGRIRELSAEQKFIGDHWRISKFPPCTATISEFLFTRAR